QLAREIGSAKPAYICQGWGPQRHSNGEQTARAIAMLSVLTGNDADVNGDSIDNGVEGSAVRVGLGTQFSFTKNFSAYTDANYL
ncbi:molybdopterin-dependent oxidoreductase, partial [Salmonella enterica subsp. enterica serovar Anatum]|nr:molybdopterin-dependent oxidoreductase [Salmonella enterica subsp. enterica serovar Anatum]